MVDPGAGGGEGRPPRRQPRAAAPPPHGPLPCPRASAGRFRTERAAALLNSAGNAVI